MKYIALLRGINVGGNKKVPMADLKKVLEELSLADVKPLLNSGNVVFSSTEKDVRVLTDKIKTRLEKEFAFQIPVILRTRDAIQSLIASDPFKNITVTAETRLYVTFRADESQKGFVKIPYESPEKDFGILKVTEGEICSFLFLSPKQGTLDLMSFVEKEFGKNVTTRNWNTVVKLAKL